MNNADVYLLYQFSFNTSLLSETKILIEVYLCLAGTFSL